MDDLTTLSLFDLETSFTESLFRECEEANSKGISWDMGDREMNSFAFQFVLVPFRRVELLCDLLRFRKTSLIMAT
jgi:hypothetical protein